MKMKCSFYQVSVGRIFICYSFIYNRESVLGTSHENVCLSVQCISYCSPGKLVDILRICQIFPNWGFALWIVFFQWYFVF